MHIITQIHGCRFDNMAIEHTARSHCHIDLPSAAALELSATADADKRRAAFSGPRAQRFGRDLGGERRGSSLSESLGILRNRGVRRSRFVTTKSWHCQACSVTAAERLVWGGRGKGENIEESGKAGARPMEDADGEGQRKEEREGSAEQGS